MRRPAGAFLLLLAALLPATASAKPSPTELTLHSRVFNNTRKLRILTPPGYDDPKNRGVRYPVFYFLDGIAAFDAWGVPEVAAQLWSEQAIPPTLFVGVDNGGSTLESTDPLRDRASEYVPYSDPSWMIDPPVPQGDRMPSFLFDEVMPLVESRYRTSRDPATTGLAGDSLAGIAALYTAINHPARFGFLLIESPSLHVGKRRLLEEAKATTTWPAAVYLGVGTEEGKTRESEVEMLANVRALYASLQPRPGVRTHLEVAAGASHGYDAWRKRLPGALRFLLSTPGKPAPSR